MRTPTDTIPFAPEQYVEHFSTTEFKFRWIDALVEVREDWCSRSVDHLARALQSHMDTQGKCWIALPTLAREMRVAKITASRALSVLEENGWLFITKRPGYTSVYQAVLPGYGLQLLLDRREERANQPSPKDWQTATDDFLSQVCVLLGIDHARWSSTSEWARVESRVRQVLQRWGGPNVDVDYLVKMSVVEPPVEPIREPIGFLLHRFSELSRLVPSTSGKKRSKQEPVKKKSLTADALEQLLRDSRPGSRLPAEKIERETGTTPIPRSSMVSFARPPL